jgi:hypothetical protein
MNILNLQKKLLFKAGNDGLNLGILGMVHIIHNIVEKER